MTQRFTALRRLPTALGIALTLATLPAFRDAAAAGGKTAEKGPAPDVAHLLAPAKEVRCILEVKSLESSFKTMLENTKKATGVDNLIYAEPERVIRIRRVDSSAGAANPYAIAFPLEKLELKLRTGNVLTEAFMNDWNRTKPMVENIYREGLRANILMVQVAMNEFFNPRNPTARNLKRVPSSRKGEKPLLRAQKEGVQIELASYELRNVGGHEIPVKFSYIIEGANPLSKTPTVRSDEIALKDCK